MSKQSHQQHRKVKPRARYHPAYLTCLKHLGVLGEKPRLRTINILDHGKSNVEARATRVETTIHANIPKQGMPGHYKQTRQKGLGPGVFWCMWLRLVSQAWPLSVTLHT
eukprot:1078175-Pelagomonas_calceolata.AAC.7